MSQYPKRTVDWHPTDRCEFTVNNHTSSWYDGAPKYYLGPRIWHSQMDGTTTWVNKDYNTYIEVSGEQDRMTMRFTIQ